MANVTLASMFWNRVERDGDRAALDVRDVPGGRPMVVEPWRSLNWTIGGRKHESESGGHGQRREHETQSSHVMRHRRS